MASRRIGHVPFRVHPDHRGVRGDRPRADRPLAAADRPVVTLDLNPLPAGLAGRTSAGSTPAASSTPNCSTGSSPRYEVDRVFHLAALLSTRSEFAPALAHKVNVEGTLNLLEFAQQQGESHGRPVVVLLPVEHRRLRPAGPGHEGESRAGSRRTNTTCRPPCTGRTSSTASTSGRYYARHYKQLAAERPREGRLPLAALPRADLGRHGAQRRHVRLRPGDDPRGGRRASPTPASSGRTRASRSWPCPTRWRRSCG